MWEKPYGDGACPLYWTDHCDAPLKKGTGTEPEAFSPRFRLLSGSEPVPFFNSRLQLSQ